MRLLVDSHVALWWLEDNPALGARCRRQLEEAEEVRFSVITPWELGIKAARGRIVIPEGLSVALVDAGLEPLAITAAHAEHAPALPPHHRDPFDRMLVAQAQLEVLTLATADEALAPYGVPLLDARR